jgi:hypothetical protein
VKPWRMLAARVIHLGSWRRSAGVATAHATAWASRVSRACWRACDPVPTGVYIPRQLALKFREEDVVLTKVRNRLGRDGVVTSTAGRRRRRSGSVGGAAAEDLRAPDHRISMRGGPVKAPGGLGGSGDHRRRRIAGAERLTGVGFGSNSGASRARGLMQKPRPAS